MELKLQLGVFVLLIQVSLAAWQRVTVIKGQTVSLSCPLTNDHKTDVDWKNPEGHVMFFNKVAGVKEKRYSINKLSKSVFTVSISNVTFKDGGNYTCFQYGHTTTVNKVEVIVLGLPKMTVAKHEGKAVVKCMAEGNRYPPQIFWRLDHGPEILSHGQVQHYNKKYVVTETLSLRPVGNRVTVKCLVRHPALHSQPLMNFVKIGRDPSKSRRTTTTSSPTAQPRGSTEVQRTTTGWVRHDTTSTYLPTRDGNGPSSESSTSLSAVPLNPVTSTGSHLNISGWTPVSETTENITFYNQTEGNRTESLDDLKKQTGTEGSSSLLVFLVTLLIFCLLVVVIFFTIKLRRAHITWKKENEDSDPSEESSKSKSSQEEKNAQGQRRRGLVNTAFTQYVVEEPTVITSVINTAALAATESGNKAQTSQPQTPGQTLAKRDIKETEL